MKQKVKQLQAVFMMVALILGLVISGLPALAAGATTPTTTIKVTGIETGSTVYAYAIALDAVDANGNHDWKYNTSGSVQKRLKDGDISTDDGIYFYTHLNTGEGASAHDGKGEAVVDETVLTLTEQTDGSYSVSNVTPGLYVITANKENSTTGYNFTIVAVNYQYSGTGVASIADENGVINVAVKKSDTPTLKKTVVENNTDQKYGDANIGDTVNFKITLTVPSYGDAWKTDHLHFIITDSLTTGLTLDTGSIKIEGTAISTTFGTSKKCNATTYTTATTGFTLNLYGEDVYQYAGQTISITYSATVNDKAKVNFDADENKATIQYSTASNSTDLSKSVTDSTYHYTYGFDTLIDGAGSATTTEITKYGIKTTTEINNKVPLAGAEFQLYDARGNLLYFTSDGQYTASSTTGAVDHLTTGSNGALTATGLDAGTYTLKESKAPTGYALDTTTYTITITPTYNATTGVLKNYTVTVSDGGSNSITFTHQKLDNGNIQTTDTSSSADTFSINNTPLLTLPETGGRGILLLTVVAIIMMAGFGTAFLLLKKKQNHQ